MITRENSTGKPLAGAEWLKIHHQAKLNERIAYAKKLASLKPKSVVDLGCATGLWLDIFNQLLPSECELIGIDSDNESLEIALSRSRTWERKVTFFQLDLEKDANLFGNQRFDSV